MSIAPPRYRTRLTVFTLLACGGLLATSTAATVIAAGETQRRLAAGHHRLWELGNNPADPRLMRIAGDTTLDPTLRTATLKLVVDGVCISEREVIFGPSAARHRAVDTLLWAMRDIPESRELRVHQHRLLNQIKFNAGELLPETQMNTLWFNALMKWIIPKSVNDRVGYCRTVG